MHGNRFSRQAALALSGLMLAALACTCGLGGITRGIVGGGGELGDYVWFDANGNGLQDDEEQGVPGVTVRLLDTNEAEVAETITDEDGNYFFSGVDAGEYVLEFIPPADFSFTLMDEGLDDGVDSDARQADGKTEPFSYGDADDSRDAGLVGFETVSTQPPPVTATPELTSTPPPASVPPELTSSYTHTMPGEYSEITIQVDNLAPGETVSGTVVGPSVDGDGSFSATADEYGTAYTTVRIFLFGTYTVDIPDLGLGATVEVNAGEPAE